MKWSLQDHFPFPSSAGFTVAAHLPIQWHPIAHPASKLSIWLEVRRDHGIHERQHGVPPKVTGSVIRFRSALSISSRKQTWSWKMAMLKRDIYKWDQMSHVAACLYRSTRGKPTEQCAKPEMPFHRTAWLRTGFVAHG